jgi:hypothetical protein
MKKFISSSLLGLALISGAMSLPSQHAHSGIIVCAATATIVGPLIGLTMSSAAFFWGIQEEGLNWRIAALFVLDENPSSQEMQDLIGKLYPDLETYLVDEVAQLLVTKAHGAQMNEQGIKEIVLSEEDLSPVLEVLSDSNPELGVRLKNDLTTTTLKT